jgi:carbamoyltransferase
MSYILGIGGYVHDASAAIIHNGRVVAAVQEERLTKVKHAGGFPYKSIEFCLNEAEISFDDLDSIAFYQSKGHFNKLMTSSLFDFLTHPLWTVKNIDKVFGRLAFQVYKNIRFKIDLQLFRKKYNFNKNKIIFFDHHKSHAASAYFSSGKSELGVLVVDSVGDSKTTSYWDCKGGKLHEVMEPVKHPNSISRIYSLITKHLGFPSMGDQYKVMGLASYGEPKFLSEMKEIIKLTKNGYTFNNKYFCWQDGYIFSSKFKKKFGNPRDSSHNISDHDKNIAASAQALFEYVVEHCIDLLVGKIQHSNISIAGGSALNCTANGKLLSSNRYDSVYVSAFSSDLGTCIGAAYLAYYEYEDQKYDPLISYLVTDSFGPSFNDDEIKKVLKRSLINYSYTENPQKYAAEEIYNGKIVGWFSGKMEFGPRSLGNRSILADPRSAEIKDRINKNIKFREEFRPFAPIILRDKMLEFYGIEVDSPFMTFTLLVVEKMRKHIEGVVHVDGTSRVQTVSENDNAILYELVNYFYKKSKVPVILNTSFNLAGEPIVCTPEDALRTFYTSGIDTLILGNFVIEKK